MTTPDEWWERRGESRSVYEESAGTVSTSTRFGTTSSSGGRIGRISRLAEAGEPKAQCMDRPKPLRESMDRRIAVLAVLGFGSGLPLALTSDTLQAWLRAAGHDLTTVGLITLVGLPYSFQVVWAPLMDRWAPRVGPLARFGRRRSWIVLTQLAIAIAIVGLALSGPTLEAKEGVATPLESIRALSLFALVLAFFSASQDIVSNAYRADVVSGRERGPAASVYVVGYRLAMVATGAGVLALADIVSWKVAYLCAAVAMLPAIAATLWAPDPPEDAGEPTTLSEAIIRPLVRFVGSPAGLVTLAFVLVFRLPDAMGNRMTMPLLQDLNFTLGQIALVRQALGLAITMLGALAAGVIVLRLGLMRGLVIFAILQMLSNAGFIVLALSEPDILLMGTVIAIESFCGGLAAAGFVAYLMACCQRRYSAMQYALLISIVDLGGRLAGAMTGFIAERTGYPVFFAITIAVGIPGLLLLPWARLGIVRDEDEASTSALKR